MAQTGSKNTGFNRVLTPGIGIYEETDKLMHRLGDVLEVGPRRFRWAQDGGSGLAPGKLVQSADPVGNDQGRAVTTNTAVGARVIPVTLGGATTVDLYKDGYIIFEEGTGLAGMYRVKSHTAAAACSVTLYDDLEKAVASADTKASLVHNQYAAMIVVPTGAQTNVVRGVPLLDVTADYYFWLQVGGPAPVLVDTGETLVIGENASLQATVEVAGAVGAEAATTQITVGKVMRVIAAAKYAMIDLKLD